MNHISSQKIIIEIFVPSGICTCSYSKWIEKIWDYIEDFREFVEIETLDTKSLRAKALGIQGQTLLINGIKVPLFHLKEKLKELVSLIDDEKQF